MIKSLIKGLLGLFLPAFVAYLVSLFENPWLTWLVAVLGYLVSAFIFRANLLTAVGCRVYNSNPEKGIKILRLAYSTGKLTAQNQLMYAYIIIRYGLLDEAETVINKALVLGRHVLTDSEVMASDFNKALITWKRGDLSSAIVQLEELYEAGYKTSAFFGSLGSFYLLNKEYDKALSLAREGVEYDREDLVSRDNLGQAYLELGMLSEAQEVYEELIPMGPSFIEAYYNYGSVLEKRGSLEEAKKFYGLALTYEEKYLSTISLETVNEAYERVCELVI